MTNDNDLAIALRAQAIALQAPRDHTSTAARVLSLLSEMQKQTSRMLNEANQLLEHEARQQAESEREIAQASEMLMRVADNLSRG